MPSYSTLTLLLLVLAQFLVAACVSLYPPLLPKLLPHRPLYVAAAFTTFESAHLATNYLLGTEKWKTWVKAGAMVTVGSFLAAASHLAFSAVVLSLTEYIVVASVFTKVFEGVGYAVFKSGCFRMASLSDGGATTALAALETSFGVGLACGPIVGGVIADAWGIANTISVFGACLMLATIPRLLLHDENERSKQSGNDSNDDCGVSELLNRPVAAMSAASIACASFGSGLIAVGLAQHLLGEQRSQLTIGVLFAVSALSYGVSCPICGSLINACSSFAHPIAFNISGLLLLSTSLAFLGYEPYSENVTLILQVSTLLVFGLGSATISVSALATLHQEAAKLGLKSNFSTLVLISRAWTFAYSVGAILGPLAAGTLIYFLGFSKAGMVMAFAPLATALVNLKLEQDYESLEGDNNSIASSEYGR